MISVKIMIRRAALLHMNASSKVSTIYFEKFLLCTWAILVWNLLDGFTFVVSVDHFRVTPGTSYL